MEPPCNTTSPQGRYHHEVQVQPDGVVLFLGSENHPVSGDLPGTHGMQTNDTIEKWDQKVLPATADRLFDESFFIPHTDRTAPSSNSTGGFFWRGCPEVSGSEDWTHSNSIHVGPSGNIIVSMRHVDQIIAISGDFGSLVWRLGGPGGDFSFPDSGDKFYHQHSAKELSNGNILLFDNGFFRPAAEGGAYSRALELKLDTELMTATKVWEYRHDPDLFALCCSSVARLDNGNTVIVFGSDDFSTDICCRVFTMVEVDPQGNTVWEVQLSAPGMPDQYRVYPILSIDGETPR